MWSVGIWRPGIDYQKFLATLYYGIPGTGKATNFKFGRCIHRVHPNKSSLLTTNRNMYTRFILVPKPMTLNDLWAGFKVIDSLDAAKMAKCSLVMTPTPCTVAGCIISIVSIGPTYSCTRALTYLLTYTVGSGRIKPAISPKRMKIEQKLTAYIKSYTYTCFRLPTNDLCARFDFEVIDSLNAAKMSKCRLWHNVECRVAGSCIISIRPTRIHALVHLLTYVHRITSALATGLQWSSFLSFLFSEWI